jgi:hypothetical protein
MLRPYNEPVPTPDYYNRRGNRVRPRGASDGTDLRNDYGQERYGSAYENPSTYTRQQLYPVRRCAGSVTRDINRTRIAYSPPPNPRRGQSCAWSKISKPTSRARGARQREASYRKVVIDPGVVPERANVLGQVLAETMDTETKEESPDRHTHLRAVRPISLQTTTGFVPFVAVFPL